MRKQTKLVAVLSAAALLAVGASMTSFAAGWTEENGTWVYYDSDDELVTNEWKKSGSNYYYLDDNGEMLTESWVDDDYYVDETGKMVTNQWEKLTNDDYDDPDGDGEAWYYFDSTGKKVTDKKKTINGKVYYFDGDGVMEDGWYEDEDNDIYYLGDEDDGARKSGWLWLEMENDDDVDLCDSDDDDEPCDDEGWYWFDKSGKLYKNAGTKKIDGKHYYFNEHGQMLYNWVILGTKNDASNPNLKDDEEGPYATEDNHKSIDDMRYAFNVDKGWRVNGWLQVDGSYAVGSEDDEDWYFFDDGKADNALTESKDVRDLLKASGSKDGKADDTSSLYSGLEDKRQVAKIKEEGKWFGINELGQMQTGLQAIYDDSEDGDYAVYYFNEDGTMRTGKVSNVEEDDGDVETYYFETSNSHKGMGVTGEESGYLYYKGKRLEADDDYKLYAIPAGTKDGETEYELYLVNKSGKIQKGQHGKKISDGKVEDFNYDLVEAVVDNNSNKYDDDDKDVLYITTDKDGVISYVSVDKDGEDKIFDKTDWQEKVEDTYEDTIDVAPYDVDFGWED